MAPGFMLQIGVADPMLVDAAVVDSVQLGELQNQIGAASNPINIELVKLHAWPEANRWLLLQFLQSLNIDTLRVNGREFTDLFDAVLDGMVPPNNMLEHTRTIQAAVETAALMKPAYPEVPADKISKRIIAMGGAALAVNKIAKRILEINNPQAHANAGGDDVHDALAAADGFIAKLRADIGVENAERPVLIYFREFFYTYNGITWCRMDDSLFHAQVTRFLQTTIPPTATFIKNVIENLKGRAYFPDWTLDPPFYIENIATGKTNNLSYIVCRNGMLNITEAMAGDTLLTLYPHDSRWFSQVALPFDYDPDAQCPRWEGFLNEVLPQTSHEDNRQQVLEEFIGYTMQPSTSREKMLIIFGNGANGKSVALNVITGLLGDKNVAAVPFDQLSERFSLGSLVGKAANITRELSHLSKLNEGLLKQLISGEPINMDAKFKDPRLMKFKAKLLVATNELPAFSDPTDGMWRRLILMPFNHQIPESQRNPNLTNELQLELPGIFNRALAGLRRLNTQGEFSDCAICAAALSNHRGSSDSAVEFFHALCVRQPGKLVHIQRLYELYDYFCDKRNRKPLGETTFGQRMKTLHIQRVRGPANSLGHRPWLYKDVGLNKDGAQWHTKYTHETNPMHHSIYHEPVKPAQAVSQPVPTASAN
jgi:P4 family phage/plasmid primase-like protien